MDSTGKFNTVFDEIKSIHFLVIQESVGISCAILIILLLIWTSLQFDDYKKALTISSKMRLFCALCLIFYLLCATISAFLFNNFIISTISIPFCRIVYVVYIFTYIMGNICMYWILSYHIQSIFPSHINKQLAISTNSMNIYRCLFSLIPTILWAIYLYLAFEHVYIADIESGRYKYCNSQFQYSLLAQIMLTSNGIFHIMIVLSMLLTIVLKSINNSNIILQEMNWKKHRFMKKLSKLIRKTTMLCIIIIISTVLMLFCSAYILQQLIFLLALDGFLKSLCIICLLEIGDKIYLKTCGTIEKCCNCIYCLDKQLNRKQTYLKYDNIGDLNVQNGKYMAPTIQDSDTGFLLTNSITITGGGDSNNNSITPLSGFTNITPKIINEEEEEKQNENSLIMLHDTDSTVMMTELELQSTIS